jgi:hypothetical protein
MQTGYKLFVLTWEGMGIKNQPPKKLKSELVAKKAGKISL